ncbi:Aste57867_22384 [Aphanomyces stellatus]|uniref:Aste57867_22384 protein n=1 Tax=Aphanomyces stellatus TaxID=120398 RepID=A0A485LLU2_9STRA|nr:hypothetical protein As57867_022314 [Aphanomyces stellatus]VFT99047.1 Aste57867_22384 [Aphanomyces stellatus]
MSTPEVVAAAPVASADERMKRVCRQFIFGRKCPRGAKCHFFHDGKLCVHFFKGHCTKEGCTFNHFVTETPATDDDTNATSSTERPVRKKETKAKSQDPPEPPSDDAPSKPKEKKSRKGKTTAPPDDSAASAIVAGDARPAIPATKPNKDMRKNPKGPRPTTDNTSTATPKAKDKSKPARAKKAKNTECFEPMTKPVDLRIVYDLGRSTDSITTPLTTRDALLAPNVFSDFAPHELYRRLVDEIQRCDVPEKDLLKLWHGNDKIEGTHLIANDRTRWKSQCPTFTLVIDRLRAFFHMDIQATRFNWYTDTAQWKPFHHDAAYVSPEKAAVQNFTVAVSFGATRDAAFEHAKTKTVVSLPQPDGCVYAFCSDTNGIWRHGILADSPVRDQGRISVIAWGKVHNMGRVAFDDVDVAISALRVE